MCGIFGFAINKRSQFTADGARKTISELFHLSESRGKEAAGVSAIEGDKIEVLKSALSATDFLKTAEYQGLLNRATSGAFGTAMTATPINPLTVVGHSRLVTTGSQDLHCNNQPVIASGLVGVHNGIVVNHEQIWPRFPAIKREFEVDTEVILRLLALFRDQSGSLIEATRKTFEVIEGATTVAVLFADLDVLLLATNNGSLYQGFDESGSSMVFASERYILETLAGKPDVSAAMGAIRISHLKPRMACILNLAEMSPTYFQLDGKGSGEPLLKGFTKRRDIVDLPEPEVRGSAQKHLAGVGLSTRPDQQTQDHLRRVADKYPYDTSFADSLRRCTKCILPETMPFIEFDTEGVCNYCQNYIPIIDLGRDALLELAGQYRRTDGRPDCVVGISGGRDSLYGLHYVKQVLGLNPVAYTYDWGMVTDLARRNSSRICGKLGIEHILVSADISKKRSFIRKNVQAWLKRPVLGTIPLFMAGDKQYFYYLLQVKKQLGVDLTFLCENMLERTDFKTGYANVTPFNKNRHYFNKLTFMRKVKLGWYYAREAMLNPAYLNDSLLDSLFAYSCFYIIDRSYVNVYNYFPWTEEEVVGTIIRDYGFELAPDCPSTWRIGDGTAAFYNYIYHTVTGFTEHDTFRSNQIREGQMTRDEALRLVRLENEPRFEAMDWYFKVINLGLDVEQVADIIHRIPKRLRKNEANPRALSA
ncbi:MAG: hypothetical protein K1X53_03810 [Candidatus Sumerlaeaceae bacterium]|nr:hypothetical protein [Candidatus Sumerlaeaceae bacterium]